MGTHECMQARTSTHKHARMQDCKIVCLHAHARTHMRTHPPARMRAQMHTQARAQVRAHAYEVVSRVEGMVVRGSRAPDRRSRETW